MTQYLDPEMLKAVVLVQETGSFHAAGMRGDIAPSTLAHRIQRLEDILGQRVFHRKSGGRTIDLTPFGETLIPIAKELLDHHERAFQRLTAHTPVKRIRIGATEDHASYILPDALNRFREAFRATEVDVQTGMTRDMRRSVPEHFDLVLAAQEDGSREGRVIAKEPLAWACHKDCQPTDIAKLALYPKGCLYRGWAEQSLQEYGRDHTTALSSFSRTAIESYLASNNAISVFPRSTLAAHLRELTPADGFPALPALELAIYTARRPAKEVQHLALCISEAVSTSQQDGS